ncbi:MAG: TolC family protein [Candidatus Hydrogenedentota bacterium]|nr:MAG: TolC family protein [Candidatus Hydrogenedentota bacterium]
MAHQVPFPRRTIPLLDNPRDSDYAIIMLRFLQQGTTLLSICLIGACASYHPLPLKNTDFVPDAEAIRILSDSISHPLLPPLIVDYRNGLSPEEAAVMAVIVNPHLKALRDERGRAAAQVLQAGLLPNPTFSYGFESPRGRNAGEKENAVSYGVNWNITSLLSRNGTIRSEKKHAASVDLDIAWSEWQTAEAAKLHLYRLVLSQSQRPLWEELLRNVREEYAAERRVVELGLADRSTLAAERNRLLRARDSLEQNRYHIERERLALNRALGVPPEMKLKPETGVVFAPPRGLPDESELTKNLETRRLDLLALRRGYESQEEKVRRAILRQFPRINIGFLTARDIDSVKTNGAEISITLPLFNQNQGEIARERATRKQLFDEYNARLFDARSEIGKILNEIAAVRAKIETVNTEIDNLLLQKRWAKKAADDGRTDIFDYYKTVSRLLKKQLEKRSLQGRLADLVIALEISSGRTLIGTIPADRSHER